MITAVDTNILIDVFKADSTFGLALRTLSGVASMRDRSSHATSSGPKAERCLFGTISSSKQCSR